MKIVELAEADPRATSRSILKKMKKTDSHISTRTVRRRLVEAGGKFQRLMKKPLLKEDHCEKRLSWALNHINYDWSQVIFTDETTVFLNRVVTKAWQFPLRRKVLRTIAHPLKVHIWGCFNINGFGRIVCFEENLTGKYMTTIYKRGLIPSVKKLFPGGKSRWILQEDNDPKHRSAIATDWNKENKIITLPWPPMSPDQNPIENVWSILKLNIQREQISSTRELKAVIRREWNKFPASLARTLVENMPKRIEALIEAQGDYTLY
jgi:hypothetical protein